MFQMEVTVVVYLNKYKLMLLQKKKNVMNILKNKI